MVLNCGAALAHDKLHVRDQPVFTSKKCIHITEGERAQKRQKEKGAVREVEKDHQTTMIHVYDTDEQ